MYQNPDKSNTSDTRIAEYERKNQSMFIERGLISDLMISPWFYNKVSGIVRGEMFQNIVYKVIFKVVEQLLTEGYVVDEALLIKRILEYSKNIQKSKFYTKQEKEELQFLSELEPLSEFTIQIANRRYEPTEEDAREKATLIKKDWMGRKALELFTSSSRSIVSGKNPYSVFSNLKNKLEALEKNENTGQYDIEAVGDEFLAIVEERMINPQSNIMPSGFQKLDETAPLTFEELHFIGARPGMGKTAIMLIHALASAKSGFPVRIFSLEMSRYKLVSRFCQYLTGINARSINNGKISNKFFEIVKKVITALKELNIHIIDDIYSIEGIKRYLRAEDFQEGLILGDYVQLAKTTKKKQNKDLEIAEITSESKRIAKSLKSCVLWLSQLSREVEKRKDKRPIISDLLYSGGIDRDADVIRMLFREEYYLSDIDKISKPNLVGYGEDIIRKNREGDLSVIEHDFKKGTWISEDIKQLFDLGFDTSQFLEEASKPQPKTPQPNDDLPF